MTLLNNLDDTLPEYCPFIQFQYQFSGDTMVQFTNYDYDIGETIEWNGMKVTLLSKIDVQGFAIVRVW